jgi:hypothetical protein
VGDQLTGRFWAKEEKASEHKGWESTNADSGSPSLAFYLGETGAESTRNELTEGNTHVIECHHAAAVFGRCQFTNYESDELARPYNLGEGKRPTIKRNNHRSTANPETDDESSSGKLANGKGACLEDGSNYEHQTGTPNGPATAESISRETSSYRSDQGTATG